VGWTLGAGPLKHPLSKFFVRHALALANYVSFRDTDIWFDSQTLVKVDEALKARLLEVDSRGGFRRGG